MLECRIPFLLPEDGGQQDVEMTDATSKTVAPTITTEATSLSVNSPPRRSLKEQLMNFGTPPTELKVSTTYVFDPLHHVSEDNMRCENCALRAYPWDCFVCKSEVGMQEPPECTNCRRSGLGCYLYEHGIEKRLRQPPLPTTDDYWMAWLLEDEEMDDGRDESERKSQTSIVAEQAGVKDVVEDAAVMIRPNQTSPLEGFDDTVPADGGVLDNEKVTGGIDSNTNPITSTSGDWLLHEPGPSPHKFRPTFPPVAPILPPPVSENAVNVVPSRCPDKGKGRAIGDETCPSSSAPEIPEPFRVAIAELANLWDTPDHLSILADAVLEKAFARILLQATFTIYPELLSAKDASAIGPISETFKQLMEAVLKERNGADIVRILSTVVLCQGEDHSRNSRGDDLLRDIIKRIADEVARLLNVKIPDDINEGTSTDGIQSRILTSNPSNFNKMVSFAPSLPLASAPLLPRPSMMVSSTTVPTSTTQGLLTSSFQLSVSSLAQETASLLAELRIKQQERLLHAQSFEATRARQETVASMTAACCVTAVQSMLVQMVKQPGTVDSRVATEILFEMRELERVTAQFEGRCAKWSLTFDPEFHDVLSKLATAFQNIGVV
ncbi:hypothetical protein BDN70DRAFT_939289 [Pholiota conissans]|uniref:Uncharacterized protein n=1 Tax=Pholiota conissans TaxID=109636 RepID=A0A9P5YJG4_9AGAR|nr:hypothetical protein BDN70DRAFT_939289 [Pholiota conissans]